MCVFSLFTEVVEIVTINFQFLVLVLSFTIQRGATLWLFPCGSRTLRSLDNQLAMSLLCLSMCVGVYMYVFIFVCVCVCLCVHDAAVIVLGNCINYSLVFCVVSH